MLLYMHSHPAPVDILTTSQLPSDCSQARVMPAHAQNGLLHMEHGPLHMWHAHANTYVSASYRYMLA